ncbi:MAG: hypothetical protein HY321_09500 [Armatimonadetes bacterium]|nr:hypothetical protein [Armatimonadota bacterium]
MSDQVNTARAEDEPRGQRPADGSRPSASPSGSSEDRSREREEEPRLRKPTRPETLPPTTTSGGIPSEPGWMQNP